MKIRTDFVTNTSSVSYIVSVRKQTLTDLLQLIPDRVYGDHTNEICGVFLSPKEFPKEQEEYRLKPFDARQRLRERKNVRIRRRLGGGKWSDETMLSARHALENGDAVVCFNLSYDFFDQEPEQWSRIDGFCEVIDSLT